VKKLLLWGLLILSLQSCSIQQRRYTGGLSIQWPTIGQHENKQTAAQKESQHRVQNEEHNTQPRSHVELFGATNQPGSEFDRKCATTPVNHPSRIDKIQARTTEHPANHPSSIEKSINKKPQQKQSKFKKSKRGKNAPGDDPILDLIFLIVGIVGALLGYDSYSGGGGGWGGGGYFDWTAFFAIGAIVLGAGGLLATAASKASMGATGLQGMMVFFTIFGGLFGLIGLIKSVRDYYDVGKYLSICAFALLAIMWIIGLV
jgi:hypothetical protein